MTAGRYSTESLSGFIEQVNLGNVVGHSMSATVGVSDSIGLSYNDISSMDSDIVYPTANETWVLTSTSANDTILGSGARQVSVLYLDDNCNQISVLIDTDGTNDVVIGTDCFRVVNAACVNFGTVRGSNLGDITIRNQSGGANRDIIEVDDGSSHSIHHTVPAGFTDYWISTSILPPKNDDIEVRALIDIGGTRHFVNFGSTVSYQDPLVFPFNNWIAMPEKTDFVQQARASNPLSKVTVVSEFLRVKN